MVGFLQRQEIHLQTLDLSQERFIRVNVDHQSVQIYNPETKARLWLPTPDELHNYTFRKAIHCDGLLLSNCRIGRGNSIKKLAVWNPISSRVTWIEPLNSYKPSDIYGFGYDNVSLDNYKILRIDQDIEQGNFSQIIEIYEFKSKLWRSVDHATTLECNALWDSVSMNGNMYWIAKKDWRNSESEIFIQSFDFSTETFKPICCVPKGTDYFNSYDHTLLLSGFGGDRLSLLDHHSNVNIEVWVTSKLTDGVVSWTKYFDVTPRPSILRSSTSRCSCFPTYFIHKTNKIMFLCEEVDYKEKYTYTNVYEICEGEIKKQVEMRGRHRLYDNPCNVYVPSLVPVPCLGELGSGEQVGTVGRKPKGMFTFWCEVCSVGAFCKKIMWRHESGKRHKAAIEKQNVYERFKPETAASTSIITVPQSEAIKADEIASGKKTEGEKKKTIINRCETCNISTLSEKVMETHKLGKKHKSLLKKQYSDSGEKGSVDHTNGN